MNTDVRFLDSPLGWPLQQWDVDPQSGLLPGRHESLLRQRPEKYSEMVQGVTSFGIYLIDRSGVIRSWNLSLIHISEPTRPY